MTEKSNRYLRFFATSRDFLRQTPFAARAPREARLPLGRIAAIAALGVAGWLVGAEAAAPSLRLKSRAEQVELPPLARVIERDETENAWNVTGRLPGGFETAFDDFRLSMNRQGWSWHTVTLRQNTSRKIALIALSKGRARLLLMIWESGPGQCGFSLGEDRAEDG